MKNIARASLTSAFALCSLCGVISCQKSGKVDGKPMNVAIEFPKLPANLAGDTWLAPFQVNILIESSDGTVQKKAVTGDTEIELTVPPGGVRIRTQYMGFALPAGMPASAICDKNLNLAGPSLNLMGGDPPAFYTASSDNTITSVPASGEFTISFASLKSVQFLRFGLTLKANESTAAANAQLTYADSLTGLPITGPCTSTAAISDTADSTGRLESDFPDLWDGIVPVVITHNGVSTPMSITLSSSNILQNIQTINLATKVASIDSPTSDFDGDGVSNQAEVAANTDPFHSSTSSGSGGYDSCSNNSQTFAVQSSSSMPYSGSTNVDRRTNVVVSFNRCINTASLTGKIKLVGATSGVTEIACESFTSTYYGIICKPASMLAPNTSYKISVAAGILSTLGESLASAVETNSFTTRTDLPSLLVTDMWPNANMNGRPIARYNNIEVKFNHSLNATTASTSPGVTLTDTATNTSVAMQCNYSENNYSNSGGGVVRCYPGTSTSSGSTALIPGHRYRISASGQTDNAGNTLAQAAQSEFTVYNNPADTTAPSITRYVPEQGATTVRPDMVLGAFFNEPVMIDAWNLASNSQFVVTNTSTSAIVPIESCSSFETFDGFLCRPQSPMAVGTYQAKIKAGTIRDYMNNMNTTDVTWTFTVTAADLTTFVRLFEHPIGQLTNLTRFNALAVFNKRLDTSMSSNSAITSTAISSSGATVPSTSGWQNTTFNSYAYQAYSEQLLSPGMFTISHSSLKSYLGETPTSTSWTAGSSMPPALAVVSRYPMPGETVESLTSLIVQVNMPVNIVTDGSNAVSSVTLKNSSNAVVPLTYVGATSTSTSALKFKTAAALSAGTYTVSIGGAGALAAISTESYTFNVSATSDFSFVTSVNSGSCSGASATVCVRFNKEIALSQPAGVFKLEKWESSAWVPQGTSASVTSQSYSNSSASWVDWNAGSLSDGLYRVTVANVLERDGSTTWLSTMSHKSEFSFYMPSPYVVSNSIAVGSSSVVTGAVSTFVQIARVYDPMGGSSGLFLASVSAGSCGVTPLVGDFAVNYLGADYELTMKVPSTPFPTGCIATFYLQNSQGKSVTFTGDISKVGP